MKLTLVLEDTTTGIQVSGTVSPSGVTDNAGISLAYQLMSRIRELILSAQRKEYLKVRDAEYNTPNRR